jgi:ferredoxin
MTRTKGLPPVAVKQSARLKGFKLISRGYVQAQETMDCPVCSLRFMLLLDRKDRNSQGSASTEIHQEAVRYFLDKVKEDHETGHPHDSFAMPPFIRHHDPATNIVESYCVLCGLAVAACHEEPELDRAEKAHNCA